MLDVLAKKNWYLSRREIPLGPELQSQL